MATEQFVDVTYRGLEIGSTVKLRELGPTTAYVELTTPMPVGTSLTIATDTGVTFGARVLRVQEQVAGAENPPGMRIAAELDGAAAEWWKPLVDSEDPVIPEPTVEVREPSEAPAETADEASAEGADAAPAEAADAAADAGEDAPADAGEPGQKKSSRTQVMDVAEIQAAIAAGGDVADVEAAAPTPVEGRATDRMEAVDIDAIEAAAANKKDDDKDDGNGKKKKRRRRRRKKKDSGS